MPRPQLHDTDVMLDAARRLLLTSGSRAATVEAIAEASGAPIGTIYHRFGSRQTLITKLWIRAVYRSQASFVAAMEDPDPKEAAVAAALSLFDFCDRHPADARLLASFGREDLIGVTPEGSLADELAALNRPVERSVVVADQAPLRAPAPSRARSRAPGRIRPSVRGDAQAAGGRPAAPSRASLRPRGDGPARARRAALGGPPRRTGGRRGRPPGSSPASPREAGPARAPPPAQGRRPAPGSGRPLRAPGSRGRLRAPAGERQRFGLSSMPDLVTSPSLIS